MFNYLGCHGEKAPSHNGKNVWMITFEDGTHDMAFDLRIALLLCNKELRRAESAN